MAEPGRDDHRDGPRQSPVILNMFKISESLPGASRLIPVDHGRPRHIPASTPGRARHTRMSATGLWRALPGSRCDCSISYLCGLLPGCNNPVNIGQKGHYLLVKKYKNIYVCYFSKHYASQSEISSNAEFMI